jgi:Tfp pilus assembly PilM family ATPase
MAKENKTGVRPEKTALSLEICEGHVKLCEAAFFKRRPPVFRFLMKETSGEPGEVSKAITNLFETHNLTARSVFLNIPRHLVMARIFHLPSVNDEEIKNMIKMEAAKQVPYRDEDIVTGYRVIEKFKDGYSDVLLAISQAGTINRFVGIIRGANLAVEKIALSSETLFLWYSTILKKSTGDAGNIGLIDMGTKYIDVDIIEKGNLVFARAFSYDPFNPEAMRKIADEIGKSVTIYQRERNLKLDKIFISGAEFKSRMIEAALKEETTIPIETIAQAEGITLAESAEKPLGEASFIELVGLSLKAGEAKIDLLPGKMKGDKEFLSFRKAVTRTLILASSVALVLFGLAAQKIFDKTRLIRLINARIKVMEPRVLKAKRMRDDLKIIKNELQKKPLAIDVLSEVYKITPGEISFNLLDYESDKSLVLRGNAPSLDRIITFLTILEDSPYLENVKLKYTTKRTARGAQKTDFEIVCAVTHRGGA